MRTISIQADGEHLDHIMQEWLADLIRAIAVGEPGIKFDGDLSSGTIVNHRAEGRWTVSFRLTATAAAGAYADLHVVARAIITREHQTDADLSARDDAAVGAGHTRALRSWVRALEISEFAGCRS